MFRHRGAKPLVPSYLQTPLPPVPAMFAVRPLLTVGALVLPSSLVAQATPAPQRAAAWRQHQAMERSSPFRALAWRPAGPVKIGARIEAIAIPPGNTGTIYAGVGTGNLWKTTNNGLSWRPIFDDQPAHSIGDVAVSPSDPAVVWVGTGEAQPRYAGYAYPGAGIFKSTDAGATWAGMGLEETHHIAKVLIHPRNPDIVLVAAMGHQWSTNPERGVYRTTDGGASWDQVLFVDDATGVVDLVMDPANPDILLAWSWTIEQGTTGGLHKSSDGGRTWRRIGRGLPGGVLGRAGIDFAADQPGVAFLFLDNRNPSPIAGRPYVGGEVYRSADGGESWRKANSDDLYPVFGRFGWKFADVRVDPRDADHLYILGNRAFHSFDGGQTWRQVGDAILRLHDTQGHALHLDHHELVIDPSNPDRLLLGNDGGLFVSHDAGESWLHVNNIPVVQFYFVTTDDRTPYRIFGGTQDNAAVYGPHDASLDDAVPDPWRSVYLDRWTGGDSYVTLPDPTDERIVYYEHQNGGMMRMDITGVSVLTGGPSAVSIRPQPGPGEPPLRFSWYTPFFLSPHSPTTLYAGGNRVLKSTDRGTTWRSISPELGDPAGTDRGPVTTGAMTMLAESPLRRGLIVGGTEGGRVWRTTDDGASWRRIDAGLPGKWVSRVTPSSHDGGVIYLSMTGYREDDTRPYVYASNDTGRTWRSIAANLPMEAVNVIKEDPWSADILYLGTDMGAYVSRDRGGSWESLSATLPTTPVHDLAVQARVGDLVLGSHGRGAWVLDLAPIRGLRGLAAGAVLHLFPIRSAVADWFPWETVPGSRRGRNVAPFQVVAGLAGPVTVTVRDSTGTEVRRWSAELVPGVNTLRWDLQSTREPGRIEDAGPGTYRIEVEGWGVMVGETIEVKVDPVLAPR